MDCGDSTIDGLLAGDASVKPLGPGGAAPAIGHLHDLLRGHGFCYLPDPRATYYSVYGSVTRRAVKDYRAKHAIGAGEIADGELLRDAVSRPAPKAIIGPAYVPLVLDVAFTPLHRFLWLTSLFETGGAFQKLNLNTDGCGVSFGILQWSQKSGQLHRVLQACHDREPQEWERMIGDAAILDYTGKANGGLDAQGFAINEAFELTRDPWKTRLEALGSGLPLQRVQLTLAVESYRAELQRVTAYAGEAASERTLAFLIDLTNQFGPARVEQHYKEAARASAGPGEILQAMEAAFTAIANPRFQPQVRARREFFRTTALLSDGPPE